MVITRATPLVAAGINRQKRRAVLCAFGNGERASAGKGALTSVGQETVSIHYPAGRPLPDPARWATGGGKMTPLGMEGGSHPGQAPGASGLCCSLHSPSFPPRPPGREFHMHLACEAESRSGRMVRRASALLVLQVRR